MNFRNLLPLSSPLTTGLWACCPVTIDRSGHASWQNCSFHQISLVVTLNPCYTQTVSLRKRLINPFNNEEKRYIYRYWGHVSAEISQLAWGRARKRMIKDFTLCGSLATTSSPRTFHTPTTSQFCSVYKLYLSVLIIGLLFVFTNETCTMKIGWASRQLNLANINCVHSFPDPNVNVRVSSILSSYFPFFSRKYLPMTLI
jgi:hypothetical protein